MMSQLPIAELRAQSMIDDVRRLSEAVGGAEEREGRSQPRAAQMTAADTLELNLMGILAAYAGPSRKEALKNSYSAEAIFQNYRHNPYFRSILQDSSIREMLRTSFDSVEVRNTIMNIRRGLRERILQKLSSGDVYAQDRMFKAQELIDDYQQPRIDNAVALETASKSAQPLSLSDPASFTATVLTGLADWIGSQAQEEFVQTFLIRLQQDLSDKQLNLLFPNTYQYLDKLNLINYRTIVANARLAFAKDLNTLSLNVSNYLFESGQLNENDPLSFSLLLIYRLVDLVQRDLPLPDMLAYANGEFSRRKFESEKILHDSMVADTNTTAYQALQETFRKANSQLINTYDSLLILKRSVGDTLSKIPAEKRRDTSFAQINAEIKRLQNKLDSFNYAGLFRGENKRFLSEVNAFLEGRLDYAYLEAYPSFETYQNTFNNEPPQPAKLRGVGLSMIRQLLRKEQGNYPIINAFKDYFQTLREWEEKVKTLRQLADAVGRESDLARQFRRQLTNPLETEENFWENIAGKHEKEAFDYQRALVANVRAQRRDAREQIKYLKRVEKLFVDHVLALKDKYPAEGENSPYFQEAASNPVHLALFRKIDRDSVVLDELRMALTQLEMTKNNRTLKRSYDNATLFSSILQSGAQLMYSLAISESENSLSWIKPAQMASVMNDDLQRQFFLGLIYQRISALTGGFEVDSRGLADISTQVVQQLVVLDTIGKDRSRFFPKIEFAGNVLNSILETPLLRTKDGDRLESLVEKFDDSGIAKVPQINRNLTELFRHTEKQDYRYALENVLQLIDLFNIYPKATKRRDNLQQRLSRKENNLVQLQRQKLQATQLTPEQKEEVRLLEKSIVRLENKIVRHDSLRYRKFRNAIFKYGHFLADVAGADDPKAMESALNTIALPVGSSQNKRLRPFSVELNAYFGGTLAYEHVLDEPEGFDNENKLNAYGLFVPVGIALSKRLGAKSNTSLSLFFPIIDLGALTAYRTDAGKKNLDTLPDLSFANVLAPGAHLMLNLPKSPFFISGGVQYGPNVREIKIGEEPETVKALRVMLSFGVDVPIISFFGQ